MAAAQLLGLLWLQTYSQGSLDRDGEPYERNSILGLGSSHSKAQLGNVKHLIKMNSYNFTVEQWPTVRCS